MAKFTLENSPVIPRRDPYPFDSIKIGKGFSVDFQLERSIRTAASKQNKKGPKKFRVSKTEKGVLVVRTK